MSFRVGGSVFAWLVVIIFVGLILLSTASHFIGAQPLFSGVVASFATIGLICQIVVLSDEIDKLLRREE